ncbi:enoyl-CoA hydratase/isomerase family protein [Pseudomonas sp. Choline-3u-10]|jgi:enoyl-CoA hydratase/carnithine racemase|uniref:enoyl-CoA hydratase/isomerase family protein n=1 Tax=Pseudomonadaceae TaxID=135621 RepID=UPI00061814D7|nr:MULTISPECIES: enoyl-CoA hydratase/isomerase family protein [Pseudomonadaceae]MAL35050.1 enoyl-CoA hydratase/isomerase family protein [Pseudomonas sp.]MBU0950489.1 enoyl-CoA hydratase/isomerase family protein [Gammaproteobacteria bacterium]KJJ65251.1 crotonase [Pseudomonas sp. 10B238]MBK3795513.1 enoyl-CoA hydratase/isomerase family protein [Stutzerimonas stutzeri]MBK3878132.1 enoyl-CoA hydratase/isomerase family protein [Stutzerimonas stutzeri]|tara:strand:+ start:503 stop:1555 length:1053 start_codon:yes stop_codon:yes gene_type:complete
MTQAEAPVLIEVRNRVGYLTLNRPAGLNAVTLEMVRMLHCQLQQWADDQDVVAVVLRGAGEKAFCAGGDIRSLYDSYKSGDSLHREFFEEEYALDQYIHAYIKPLMALMNGFVLGGGMGLVQGASLRVISERTRMGMPEVGIGYFPDVGGSYFLSRLPNNLGIYMGLTGNHVNAADALYAGLADYSVPHEQFAELERCLDQQDWSMPPLQALTNLLVSMGCTELPDAPFKALFPAIEKHFAHDSVAAIRQSLAAEEHPEYRDWAAETLKVIDSRSPLSVSVTLEMLRRGRTLSLADCFAMELHLDRQWFDQGDIIEGVRALIVDKDKNPRWNPPTLEEVTPARVAAFFAD